MVKVPDTNTFGLTDVKAVVELDSESGSYVGATFDPGTGKTQLNNATNTDVEIGDTVTVTSSTYYDGSHIVLGRTSSTIIINAIFLGSDSGLWGLEIFSLTDCFQNADSVKFDWRYEGSKDRQSNFRNYGDQGTGALSGGDHQDQAGYHWGLHASPYFVFVACMEFGVRCYDMTTVGILTLKNTAGAPGNEGFRDVWTQDGLLFVTSSDNVANENYVRSFTYDTGTGVMTGADSIQSSSNSGTTHIFGDETDLLFVVEPNTTTSYGIHSFTYDGSGNLTYKAAYTTGSYRYHKGVYADGHLFVVGNNGISSFTRNTSTGVLTLVDNNNTGTFVGTSIIYDSVTGLLLLGSEADGAIVYSHSSGVLTQEYFEGSGRRMHPAYHSSANYLYYTDETPGNIHRYQLNISNDLDYVGSQALGIVERLVIWDDEAPNVLTCSDGDEGIWTFVIDYD